MVCVCLMVVCVFDGGGGMYVFVCGVCLMVVVVWCVFLFDGGGVCMCVFGDCGGVCVFDGGGGAVCVCLMVVVSMVWCGCWR